MNFVAAQCKFHLRRLMQNTVVMLFIISVFFLPLFDLLLLLNLFNGKFYFISLLYSVWYIYDYNSCNRGGRRREWYRNLRISSYFAEYFPIRMVKTSELPPTKNYLMCYHPHGIICTGVAACFASEGTNFKKEFPGLTPYPLVSEIPFRFPVTREHFLAMGCCSVSKDSIEWLLSKMGTGNALSLVVGGAAEIMEAHPGTANLILRKRKGFVKLALKHGASLVPIFAFGENDKFRQVQNPVGSYLRSIQNFLYRHVGFPFPLAYGYLGILFPYRRPITVVIGKPIDLDAIADPTQEQIDATHELYISELRNLFETHKSKYDPNLQLNIT